MLVEAQVVVDYQTQVLVGFNASYDFVVEAQYRKVTICLVPSPKVDLIDLGIVEGQIPRTGCVT